MLFFAATTYHYGSRKNLDHAIHISLDLGLYVPYNLDLCGVAFVLNIQCDSEHLYISTLFSHVHYVTSYSCTVLTLLTNDLVLLIAFHVIYKLLIRVDFWFFLFMVVSACPTFCGQRAASRAPI